jgi:hypothetical protein
MVTDAKERMVCIQEGIATLAKHTWSKTCMVHEFHKHISCCLLGSSPLEFQAMLNPQKPMIEASDENVVLTRHQVKIGNRPKTSMARLARQCQTSKASKVFFPRRSVVSCEGGRERG